MFEKPAARDVFKIPDVYKEKGEFERVSQAWGIDNSVLFFQATQGSMVTLTDDVWSRLENSDSYDIPLDGHDVAKQQADQVGRDYHAVADEMYAGVTSGDLVDAPIVMKIGDRYHLVSGNTRLMAARAYGVHPQVWLFEIDHDD